MRAFSAIDTRFWIQPELQNLSLEARLIALYVISGPHTTMLGCFRLPKNYIAEDLKIPWEKVDQGFAELTAVDFLLFDEKSSWLLVPGFFTWNPIQNPKHGQGIEKLFAQVPADLKLREHLYTLLQSQPHLPSSFGKGIDTLSKPYLKGINTVSPKKEEVHSQIGLQKSSLPHSPCSSKVTLSSANPISTLSKAYAKGIETVSRPFRYTDNDNDKDIDNDKETDKDTEKGVLPTIVELGSSVAARPGGSSTDLSFIFNVWKTTLGHPNAVLDDKRKAVISKALKSGYSVDQLCQAITGCSLTPHNLGKNDRGQRYDGLHLILRDADQIDRFIRNAQSPPQLRNAAQSIVDSNAAVCQNWLSSKLQKEAC